MKSNVLLSLGFILQLSSLGSIQAGQESSYPTLFENTATRTIRSFIVSGNRCEEMIPQHVRNKMKQDAENLARLACLNYYSDSVCERDSPTAIIQIRTESALVCQAEAVFRGYGEPIEPSLFLAYEKVTNQWELDIGKEHKKDPCNILARHFPELLFTAAAATEDAAILKCENNGFSTCKLIDTMTFSHDNQYDCTVAAAVRGR